MLRIRHGVVFFHLFFQIKLWNTINWNIQDNEDETEIKWPVDELFFKKTWNVIPPSCTLCAHFIKGYYICWQTFPIQLFFVGSMNWKRERYFKNFCLLSFLQEALNLSLDAQSWEGTLRKGGEEVTEIRRILKQHGTCKFLPLFSCYIVLKLNSESSKLYLLS